MPPHRRSPVARRPRVAGRHHADLPGADLPGADLPGADLPGRQSGSSAGGLENGSVVDGESGRPTGPEPGSLGTPMVRIALLVIGVVALVSAVVLAGLFRNEANELSGSVAASNAALVDVGATAQVSGQVREAVQQVYSYDFARLDENEQAARTVITGPFAEDFDQEFARVRELAPPQQAVVVATVLDLAVKVLDGDRAIVVVFLDQQAIRGLETQPLLVAGRLTVTAHQVDGSWKIADVVPF